MPEPDENLGEIELFDREINEEDLTVDEISDRDYANLDMDSRSLTGIARMMETGYGKSQTRKSSYDVNSGNLTGRVEEVDEFFEDKGFEPVLYTVEDTQYALMTRGDVSENQTVVLGMEGRIEDYLCELQPEDFDRFEGQYLSPANVDEVLIKLDEPEQESIPADIDLDNIDLQIPADGTFRPEDTPSMEYALRKPETLDSI